VIRSVSIALAVSLAVHAVLAFAFVGISSFSSEPKVLAELDLSSVELSFSEEETESAPVPLAAASAPAAPVELKPKPVEKPPETLPDKRLPPDPGEVRVREPEETFSEMKTPPRPPKEQEKSRPAAEASEPSRPAPRQAHIDAPPRPKRTIRPDYPKGARQRGESGRVVLEIDVAADGTCSSVRVAVSSGFAELDESALRAARAARFTPAKSAGKSVASTARLALDFRLR